jgi:hypothetical protein
VTDRAGNKAQKKMRVRIEQGAKGGHHG